MRPTLLLPLLLCLTLAAPARAQDANPVLSADDAFGLSVGRETIGLYNSGSVRGFSPSAAGNLRIDGLYFDQVWSPNNRVRQASTIRVGLSSQGYAFPAPTGIVDYRLRRPADSAGGTLALGVDDFGSAYLDVDGSAPLGGGWSVNGGVSLNRTGYFNGTDGQGSAAGLGLWWRPDSATELGLFIAHSRAWNDENSPLLVPADGARLPPRSQRLRFDGPRWVDYEGEGLNQGLLLRHRLSATWALRAGLFRSAQQDRSSFTHLLLDLQPDGSARRVIVADPPARTAATSGELRAVATLPGARLQQQWQFNLTGRSRDRQTGGSDRVDFGAAQLGQRFEPPQPLWRFGASTQDAVRQWTAGASYQLRWQGGIEALIGLQQTHYRKAVARPANERVSTEARPLLPSFSAAWTLSPAWQLYAGSTRGLEESGTAPDTATNRRQALPAIRTRQLDAGLRWQPAAGGLRAVLGAFEVRKPYLNLDASNTFTELGEVRHRGLELSLSGPLSAELQGVAGAVLMQPRVLGEAVRLGRVGPRPVGQAEQQLRVNLSWTPAGWGGTSLDAGASHTGRLPATRDNRTELPAITVADLGLRWPLTLSGLGGQRLQARLAVANAFNRRGFELRGSGSYAERPGRQTSLSLSGAF